MRRSQSAAKLVHAPARGRVDAQAGEGWALASEGDGRNDGWQEHRQVYQQPLGTVVGQLRRSYMPPETCRDASRFASVWDLRVYVR